MKTKYSFQTYRLLILVLSLIVISCNKNFLEQPNPDALSQGQIFSDSSLLRLYINDIYNDIPGWDYDIYNNISDEARDNFPTQTPNNVLKGAWDATNNPMDIWASAYASIRKMNEFFQNIKTSTIAPASVASMSSEIYFLRALKYFDLVKRYGGVPIITEAQSLSDSLMVSRASTDSTFQFILNDIAKALPNLPDDAASGYATKAAAMALKGRVLLYWASPLYNTSNDISRWKAAAQANQDVINLNKFQLYNDLTTLWLNSPNNESIFQVDYSYPEKTAGIDGIAKPLRIAIDDVGQCQPLQELINGFPMANGKSISDPTSGYDPNNPYVGRDKRFYAFIGYNGSTVYGIVNGIIQPITLQIYDGGVDYNGTDLYGNTITGYYCQKAIDPNDIHYDGNFGGTQPFMVFRYAETLLNYAEAQNEYSGPNQSVYDALNTIRARDGITIPVSNLSKDSLRNLIRNERYVELCFEYHRYWDLRRWKLAGTVLNNVEKTGVFITKTGTNSFTYKYIPVDPQPIVFLDKMYFMPIPQSEISKNKNLVQNPGWQ